MKNIKCIFPLLVICICVFSSCTQETREKKFFDIPGYFKGEIEYVRNNIAFVSKMAVYNQDTSTTKLKVDEINWEKEFAIFLECDINKPMYYANMDTGRLYMTEMPPLQGLGYKDRTGKLNIESVEVYFANPLGDKNPVYVVIELKKSNLISNSSIRAFYYKGHSYQIWGEQSIKNLGDKNTFFVRGDFQ